MDLNTILIGSVGFFLAILIPGISLSLALFPRKEDLDIIERFGLSLVLGLTPQFLLYFNSKNFFIPVNTETTALTILTVTFIGILIWWFRKGKR